MRGRIIKNLSGLYTVEADGKTYECSARGIFRKRKITPLAGDYVEISEVNPTERRIDEIFERKNSLLRPPVANIDILFVVIAAQDPEPDLLLTDKIIAIAEHNSIEPVICINKCDIANADEITEIYKKSNFTVIECSAADNTGIDKIKAILESKTVAFAGASGVGKSSIISSLSEELMLKTGDLSERTKRGKHTTRHSELYKAFGGYIADTPGFSNLDLEKFELIMKENLPDAFSDFIPYYDSCKFKDCTHIKETGCAVIEAVKNGHISKTRHNSFISMYKQVKDLKEWQLKHN